MRAAGRAALAAVVALVVGLVLSYLLAGALRSAAPGEQLLSRVAPTPKLAVWTFTAAHGVPIRVGAGAEVENERLKRIGELFGPRELGGGASLVVRLAPMTLLAIVGLIIAAGLRGSGAGPPDVVPAVLTAAGVYGAGLALLAASAGSWAGLDGRIVRFGVGVSLSPGYTFLAGALWAVVFAAAGIMGAARLREPLTPLVRAVWTGFVRASVVATITSIVALIVLAVEQAVGAGGVHLDARLGAVGLALFAVNLIAAGIVLAHGVPLRVAFAAGPLSRFTTIGYVPSGQATLSPARYVFVLVPLLSLIAAGRAMRKHVSRADTGRAAVAFGVLWGIVLAALAFMLRVRMLSTFDIGALRAGGGAAINVVVTFVAGTVFATALSYVGLVAGRDRGPAAPPAVVADRPRTCEVCGSEIPALDAFCGVCGRPVRRD